MNNKYVITDSDLYMCKYSTSKKDNCGCFVPYCTLSDLPCDDVLRYADKACKYTKEEEKDEW